MYNICLLPGDGIGLEVIPAAQKVLEATGLNFSFTQAEAGWETFQKKGTSVPEETIAVTKTVDATLAGAFTSPKSYVKGHFGAIRFLRRELDLFANIRPAKTRSVKGSFENVNLLMVRENTEGLYVANERSYGDVAIADSVITRPASKRIAEIALKHARARQKKLAIVHKANVLPITSGLFLETALEEAKKYQDVDTTDVIVDAAAMWLVRAPESFDVLVTTNLFGDILSDLTAGLVGGLGLAPSANIGSEYAIFEPVHGSAPDIAGKGIANPTATILTAAMMLEYLGESTAASYIDEAINKVLETGPLTPDLGGKASTIEFTDAVIAVLKS